MTARAAADACAPLPPAAIRARRRPGVVAAVYAAKTAVAFLLALPLAGVAREAVGRHPRGDAVLFDPGALFLLETVRLVRPALRAIAAPSAAILLGACWAGLVPLAALLWALRHGGRLRANDLAARSVAALGPLSVLLGGALVLTTAVAAAGAVLVRGPGARLTEMAGPRGGDVARLGLIAATLLAIAAVGVWHDLARAWCVSRAEGGVASARAAWRLFRAGPWRALGAWGARASAGVGLVAVAAALTGGLGVETVARVCAVTVVHQLVAFALVALRASWLAWALRACVRAAATPQEADR